jgi:threonine/homoserine/homoserine lactone efflux protein
MLFFEGFLIGFAIAAPIGPIALLCINKSLKEGFWSGFISGLGAACADATCGFIAALGLSMVSDFFLHHKNGIQIFGGIFLLYIGIKIVFGVKKHIDPVIKLKKSTYIKSFITTYILTIANPISILAFLTVFASLGDIGIKGSFSILTIVLGVFAGSGIYFFALTLATAKFLKKSINEKVSRAISLVSGCLIIAFGLYALRILV